MDLKVRGLFGTIFILSLFLLIAACRQTVTQEEVTYGPGCIVPDEVLEREGVDSFFVCMEIPDTIFDFMLGRSYKEDCLIQRSDLRYLIIMYRDFEGQAVVGELVVNKEISADILEIMRELYEISYPIEQVRLVDYYEGDDELSMAANNSSAFNWRPLTGSTTKISRHAMGMAIDINPLYNPYYKFYHGLETIKPREGEPYVDRMSGYPYQIEEGDVCYQLFMERGFKWGGDWRSLKDYQHFEK